MAWLEHAETRRPTSPAARKRAAVEIVSRHEQSLKRTAQRYSLCAEDAEDAYQRALEILLVKAPTTDVRELIRWTQTVTKHEALAVRRNRERLLGRAAPTGGGSYGTPDWVELIAVEGDGPDERAERREAIARSREALQALRPAELRALTLLAEGYSYSEIGELTGFSRTKVNRCLAEGRERFRNLLSRSEDGSRCRELRPLLSAFCDGEASAGEAAKLREHLRACAPCRATMRAYRAAPRAAAALSPALSALQSLLGRVQEALTELHARLPGRGGGADSAATQVAATAGAHGAGMAAVAKVLTLCAGAAGGIAACVAAGGPPPPLGVSPDRATEPPAIERRADRSAGAPASEAPAHEPTPIPPLPGKRRESRQAPEEAKSVSSPPPAAAVEYTAPESAPAPVPAPASPSASAAPDVSDGSVAGEFGP